MLNPGLPEFCFLQGSLMELLRTVQSSNSTEGIGARLPGYSLAADQVLQGRVFVSEEGDEVVRGNMSRWEKVGAISKTGVNSMKMTLCS